MDVVDFYTGSWISDDRDGVRRVLAPDADIDWNLDAPVDDEELVQTLHRIAVFADEVTVVSRSTADDGAALVYELAAPFGTVRMAEFLAVEDGRVTEVRQVYDVVAVDRFFPGLYQR
jgi:ketosteroid isomerase-like protein